MPRQSKCRICRGLFVKRSVAHKDCSPECAIEGVKLDKAKKERKVYRDSKAKLKTRREWLRDAQVAFNKFIRKRDENDPCISCGRHHTGQYHAGHYLSTGAHPALRFDEANCHKQCQPCNSHLSWNIARYRPALIAKIGQAEVDRLEGPHDPKKWTIPELRAIRVEYNRKARELG